MKRLILIAAFVLAAGTVAAQNCITVNSEKLFKSLDTYNAAIEQLDSLASAYQKQVDARFAEVEELYNTYMAQKRTLTAAMQQSRENAILTKEKEAQQYQESIFGNEGTLMWRSSSRFRSRYSPSSRPMPPRWGPTWSSTRPTTRRCSTTRSAPTIRSKLSND